MRKNIWYLALCTITISCENSKSTYAPSLSCAETLQTRSFSLKRCVLMRDETLGLKHASPAFHLLWKEWEKYSSGVSTVPLKVSHMYCLTARVNINMFWKHILLVWGKWKFAGNISNYKNHLTHLQLIIPISTIIIMVSSVLLCQSYLWESYYQVIWGKVTKIWILPKGTEGVQEQTRFFPRNK